MSLDSYSGSITGMQSWREQGFPTLGAKATLSLLRITNIPQMGAILSLVLCHTALFLLDRLQLTPVLCGCAGSQTALISPKH